MIDAREARAKAQENMLETPIKEEAASILVGIEAEVNQAIEQGQLSITYDVHYTTNSSFDVSTEYYKAVGIVIKQLQELGYEVKTSAKDKNSGYTRPQYFISLIIKW